MTSVKFQDQEVLVESNEQYPFVDIKLLNYLKKTFPNKCPNITDSDREIWVKAGKQMLIEHLEYIHEENFNTSN